MNSRKIKILVIFGLVMMSAVNIMQTVKADNAPELAWSKTFGTSSTMSKSGDHGYCVQQTNDGGYIITGVAYTYGAGKGDVWLIKTDSNGEKDWDKTFGGSETERGESVQQTGDGGYIIVGYTSSSIAGKMNIWLIKTDSEGDKDWDKTFGGSDPVYSAEIGYCVQQTSDGGYILTGSKTTYDSGYDSDVWLIKTDSEGNKDWDKTFGGTNLDWGQSVQQTSDGGYIITGSTTSYGAGGRDYWLIKTDSEGNKDWDKTFGDSSDEWGTSVQQTSDGGYILIGATHTYGAGKGDVWLIKTDTNGDEQWKKDIWGEHVLWGTGECVQQTNDGGYIISGVIIPGGTGRGVIVRTDANGERFWEKRVGLNARCVRQTTDGGYIVTGSDGCFLYKTRPEEITSDDKESDAYWLAKAIMNEAGNYALEEKIAVGWTVINRLDLGRFGKDMKEVVKNGYEPYWIIPHKEPTSDVISLAEELLDMKIPDSTQGATHFFSPKSMTGGYGPYKIPGTDKRAYIPDWAIPKGYSKISPPPSGWEMTDSYQTIDYPTTEWTGDLENIENWNFMFYRPLTSQDTILDDGEKGDDTISGIETDGAPWF